MRYILNNSGYIQAISFNNAMTCDNKSCTEYTGSVPTGYGSLEEWNENANINAYKIVDGNLTYDSEEDARLQALWTSQSNANSSNTNYSTEEQVIGTWADGKPLYRKVVIGNTNPNDRNTGINVSDLNVDIMINMYGTINSQHGHRWKLDTTFKNEAENYWNNVYYAYADKSVHIEYGHYFAGTNYTLIIEYTKTTD